MGKKLCPIGKGESASLIMQSTLHHMGLTLIKASWEYENEVKNLMQFYMYDFSEYVMCDVEDNGLFKDYHGLDEYLKNENNKFLYIIKKEQKYAGFVLVRFIESNEKNYFSIAEFFVMKKYRREGIGRTIAKQIFDLHKGQWEVYQRESNKPAQIFWNKVINEYTKGQFSEPAKDGRRIQHFEN